MILKIWPQQVKMCSCHPFRLEIIYAALSIYIVIKDEILLKRHLNPESA